jgi:hypothetical protein
MALPSITPPRTRGHGPEPYNLHLIISTAALRDKNVAGLQRSPTLRAKLRVKKARLTNNALSRHSRLFNIEKTRRQCGSGEGAMGVLIGQVPVGFGFGYRTAGSALGLPGTSYSKVDCPTGRVR